MAQLLAGGAIAPQDQRALCVLASPPARPNKYASATKLRSVGQEPNVHSDASGMALLLKRRRRHLGFTLSFNQKQCPACLINIAQ